jgi:hypothetical protein
LFESIHALGLRYDIALVDPFHSYDISYRDLADALGIITDRGAVVIHDCFPPNEDLISQSWTPGDWCGVTFMAFIDFLNDNRGLTYATVDTDYGCGVLRNGNAQPARKRELLDAWKAMRHDTGAAYRFMSENKASLLNVMSVDEFKAAEMQRLRAN